MKQRNKGNRGNAIDTLKKQLKARATSILREIPATEDYTTYSSFKILLVELEMSRLVKYLHVFYKDRKGTYQAYIQFIGEPASDKPASALYHSTHDFKRPNGWKYDQVFLAAILGERDSVLALELAQAYIDQNEDTDVWVLPTGFSVLACGKISPARQHEIFSGLVTMMGKAEEFSKMDEERSVAVMDFTPFLSYFEKTSKGLFKTSLSFLWKSFFAPITAYCLDKGKRVKFLSITEIDYSVAEQVAMKEFADTRGLKVHSSPIGLIALTLDEQVFQKEPVQ